MDLHSLSHLANLLRSSATLRLVTRIFFPVVAKTSWIMIYSVQVSRWESDLWEIETSAPLRICISVCKLFAIEHYAFMTRGVAKAFWIMIYIAIVSPGGGFAIYRNISRHGVVGSPNLWSIAHLHLSFDMQIISAVQHGFISCAISLRNILNIARYIIYT